MKELLEVDYRDLDYVTKTGVMTVKYIDGTTETFTSEEDMKVVHAKVAEQMRTSLTNTES